MIALSTNLESFSLPPKFDFSNSLLKIEEEKHFHRDKYSKQNTEGVWNYELNLDYPNHFKGVPKGGLYRHKKL